MWTGWGRSFLVVKNRMTAGRSNFDPKGKSDNPDLVQMLPEEKRVRILVLGPSSAIRVEHARCIRLIG
jgi:hypothetical protein